MKTGETEEYWTKAVADFMKLGMQEAVVPLTSFNYDTAKRIAAKLEVSLEVRGNDYVFQQNVVNE